MNINNNNTMVNYGQNSNIDSILIENQNQMFRDVLQMPHLTDDIIKKQSDLTNIMVHHVGNVEKNRNIESLTEVNVVRVRGITDEIWNDKYVIEQLNKMSMYNDSITQYKTRIQDIIHPIDCFDHLKDVSKELTLSILKTLRLRDRGGDLEAFIQVVAKAKGENQELIDLHKIYNVLLYSVPYAFSLLTNDPTLVDSVMNHCSFEFCALTIENLNLSLNSCDLNMYMRLQARIEGNLPDIGRYRDMYDTMLPFVNRGLLMYHNMYNHIYSHRYHYMWLPLLGAGPRYLPIGVNTIVRVLTRHQPDIPLIVGTANNNADIMERIWLQILGDYS